MLEVREKRIDIDFDRLGVIGIPRRIVADRDLIDTLRLGFVGTDGRDGYGRANKEC